MKAIGLDMDELNFINQLLKIKAVALSSRYRSPDKATFRQSRPNKSRVFAALLCCNHGGGKRLEDALNE